MDVSNMLEHLIQYDNIAESDRKQLNQSVDITLDGSTLRLSLTDNTISRLLDLMNEKPKTMPCIKLLPIYSEELSDIVTVTNLTITSGLTGITYTVTLMSRTDNVLYKSDVPPANYIIGNDYIVHGTVYAAEFNSDIPYTKLALCSIEPFIDCEEE